MKSRYETRSHDRHQAHKASSLSYRGFVVPCADPSKMTTTGYITVYVLKGGEKGAVIPFHLFFAPLEAHPASGRPDAL